MIERLEQLLQRVRVRGAQPRPVPRRDVSAVSGKTADTAVTSVSQRTLAAQAVAAEQARADHDSEERLVASPLEPPEEPTVVAASSQAQDSIPPIDVTEVEIVEEEEEEAPISSRRTVSSEPEEQLAEMAFGREEEPAQPLHTPPPESGRLPAAPVADFDPDITGVRTSTPSAPHRPAERERELVPEALRPDLAPSDAIAEIIAKAQSSTPATFVALLDTSLSL
jgi:hypothetical protein